MELPNVVRDFLPLHQDSVSREKKESTVPILRNISEQIFYISFGIEPKIFLPMIDCEMQCIPLWSESKIYLQVLVHPSEK